MIKRINGNHGQGHIEMILSMVLFVGALIFIFIFINPFSRITGGISIIGDVEEGVIGNITQPVEKLSAVIDDINGIECLAIESAYGTNYKIVPDSTNPNKVDFYFADFFSGGGCPNDYRLGSFTEEDIVIYDLIGDLKDNYNNDYSSLKDSLNLLNDFSFRINNDNTVRSDYISYWKFEGNANDEKNINNGIWEAGEGYDVGVAGQAGKFDGSTSYVNVGTTLFDIYVTNEFTISLWFKTSDIASGGVLIGRGNNQPFEILIEDSKIKANTLDTVESSILENDKWYHLAFSYEGIGNTGKIYLNGSLDNSGDAGGISATPESKEVNIGRREIAGANYFTGLIDELMIYNHALDSGEISNIYESQINFIDLSPISKQPPVSVDVESKDIPLRALKNDGTFEELILNIRAW